MWFFVLSVLDVVVDVVWVICVGVWGYIMKGLLGVEVSRVVYVVVDGDVVFLLWFVGFVFDVFGVVVGEIVIVIDEFDCLFVCE